MFTMQDTAIGRVYTISPHTQFISADVTNTTSAARVLPVMTYTRNIKTRMIFFAIKANDMLKVLV